MNERIKRPAVANVQAALKAYYSPDGYMGSKDIEVMFGVKSATASRLKKQVEYAHAEKAIPKYVPHKVKSSLAFDVWGIDVKTLEKNWKKQKELGLLEE